MKALSTSLVVVVTAIVLLVVTLVVLTIFSTGVTQFGSLTDAKNNCLTIGSASCQTINNLPATWNQNTIKVQNGNPTSCAVVTGISACSGFTSTNTQNPGQPI